MSTIVFLHHVNGTTKVARLTAPQIVTQPAGAGGINVELFDEHTARIGYMLATGGGLVALEGAAIDQYEPLHQGDPDARRTHHTQEATDAA